MIPEQQKKILIILIIMFSVSLIYRIMNPYKQEHVKKLTYTGKQNAEPEKSSEDNKDSVDALLKTKLITEPPIHSGKVINKRFFRKIPGIKPVISQKDSETEPLADNKKIPEIEIPRPLPEPVESPEDIINRELAKFQVIGLYARGPELAIFLKRQKQIIVIRKGDRIDGKYLVKDITKEAVTLKAEHINDTVHIDLSRFLKPYEKDQLPK